MCKYLVTLYSLSFFFRSQDILQVHLILIMEAQWLYSLPTKIISPKFELVYFFKYQGYLPPQLTICGFSHHFFKILWEHIHIIIEIFIILQLELELTTEKRKWNETYRNCKAHFYRCKQDPKEGSCASKEIHFVNLPDFVCFFMVNKSWNNGKNYCC